jgi:hypothetical protein
MHMRPWRSLSGLFTSGRRDTGAESTAAVEAATRSLERAVEDRCRASAQRAEAEVWAERIRIHNAANRYDDFLRQVMRGDA